MFGLIGKIVSILGPFVVRTVFIYMLGAEYLGLDSLFISILTILNLTELGFNSAIVFCMYKPISEDDVNTINALLLFYKRVYQLIGFIILGMGLCVVPFLPRLIKGSWPNDINISFVYCVFLINTVLSYFLYAYLGAIISAFQREDIFSKIRTVVVLLSSITQVLVLLLFSNYYIYIFTMVIFTIVNNVCIAVVSKKMFPQFTACGKLSSEVKSTIKEKLKGLIICKVCAVSRNALDSIFISMFLGLNLTAAYNNYYYVMSAAISVMAIITSALLAGIGNSVVTSSIDKNYNDYKKLNFFYVWIAGWFSVCLFCLYQPFMIMWVGKELLLSFDCVILFSLYFLILKSGDILSVYIQATGMWWEMRYRSIAETISNVILNYLLGKMWGIQGIIIATMISMIVFGVYMSSSVFFLKYFGREKFYDFIVDYVKYIVAAVFVGAITFLLCHNVNYSVCGFFMRSIICLFIPNVLFYILYHRTRIYKISMNWIIPKLQILNKERE